ncbi:hypothetical protein ACNKHV_26665 [Shigella flexneri]
MTRTTTVAVVGTFMGLYPNPFNILLTILGAISYATEDSLAAGVIALMVAISTLLNFIQEARTTKAADALKAMVSNTGRCCA